jgi:hypothetical protein
MSGADWVVVTSNHLYRCHDFQTPIPATVSVWYAANGETHTCAPATNIVVPYDAGRMTVTVNAATLNELYPTQYYYIINNYLIKRVCSDAIRGFLPDPPGYLCVSASAPNDCVWNTSSTWRLTPEIQMFGFSVIGDIVCPKVVNPIDWLSSVIGNSKTVFVCDSQHPDLEITSKINNLAFVSHFPTVLQNLIWEYTRTFFHLLQLKYPTVSFLIAPCGDHDKK